ncbi:MAG TPA: hypothetical protein VGG10_22605 [Rhizomicrobium sp.]|jgi:hypothetical protein
MIRTVIVALALLLFVPSIALGDLVKGNDASSVPGTVWQFEPSGDARHVQSNWDCPVTIADIPRIQIVVYDTMGTDVSCGYMQGRTSLTLYLTKTDKPVDAAFEEAKAALIKRLPDAKLLPPQEQTTFDTPLALQHVLYSYHDGEEDTGVWIGEISSWLFEVRIDYRPADRDGTFALLTKVTSLALQTAGAHLEACAKAPAGARTGKLIVDKDLTMTYSLVSGASTMIGNKPEFPKPSAPNWCFETVVDGFGQTVLWRDIANNADRLTLGMDEKQQTLVSASDAFIQAVAKETAKDFATIYVATLTQGKRVFTLGFYDGRPDAETLATLARDVLTGKQHPLSSFELGTKTISVDTQSDAK